MPYYELKSFLENQILFEGQFPSFVECLERAVADRVDLSGIDLAKRNLSNANLDDAIMPNALLAGANLTGTNLSEAKMSGSNFFGAALYNTCLCYSDLTLCNFEDCRFGATDIAGAVLDGSRFSTLSTFSLDLINAGSMADCVFCDSSGQICQLSKPPVVIQGLFHQPLILMDKDMKIGNSLKARPELNAVLEEKVFVDTKKRETA